MEDQELIQRVSDLLGMKEKIVVKTPFVEIIKMLVTRLEDMKYD